MSRLKIRQLGKVHVASFMDSGFAVRAAGGELVAEVEKQAAWRRRRDARTVQLQAELEQLRSQSKPANREQQLHTERTEPNARHADQLSTARKLIEEIRARPNLNAKGSQLAKAALAEITKVHTNYVTGLRRIDAKIAELAEVVPDVKLDARRRKIQDLIDRGSTEGERAAAPHRRHVIARPRVRKFSDRAGRAFG